MKVPAIAIAAAIAATAAIAAAAAAAAAAAIAATAAEAAAAAAAATTAAGAATAAGAKTKAVVVASESNTHCTLGAAVASCRATPTTAIGVIHSVHVVYFGAQHSKHHRY